MPLKAQYQAHTLHFRFEATTSRGTVSSKTSWYIRVFDDANPAVFGLGECSPLQGLSIDDQPNFEAILNEICQDFSESDLEIFAWNIPIIAEQMVSKRWPSIRFGLETALLDFLNGGKRVLFDNDFALKQKPIAINGLIWMGSHDNMLAQVEEKLEAGFDTLKLKIGAIDFEQECAILKHIRQRFSANQITLRVDANGAFDAQNVVEKLNRLADFELHSIEQPIKPKQTELMAQLCRTSPVPIALDEELIGTFDYGQKRQLLKTIQPQYIVLKPTLLGGFGQTTEWIESARRLGIDWWVTSALESNVGLNAIAQFTAEFNNPLPQGLGTGQLYHNNVESPLEIINSHLHYNPQKNWDYSNISLTGI
ncbi:MAG: o-succinylbenzoate synthase [Cytophagia bacterium]|nr:MAG: o-succinylbenzoate synthase [Runella sp.]TAG18925.1 MAG: o-succinylbenzoate synthase [Cytophagales bacterium]TAG39563.1 MAG: o-succinylbenzoate synthase [Cytophagia bacterium]TAG51141.1 MAG: o-succinylbenzoate synthase [Runella slithyformis]TAG81169.1 MAG: o-succinylbenzoate synthase [Cytophagales bacterium]